MSGAVVSPAVIVLTTCVVVVVVGAVSVTEGVLTVGVGSGVGVDTGAGAGVGVDIGAGVDTGAGSGAGGIVGAGGVFGTLVSTVTSPKANTGAACSVRIDKTSANDKNFKKL